MRNMTMKINKYKVSQELMNDIDDWKFRVGHLVIGQDFMIENALPVNLDKWWVGSSEYNSEKNNRLIALVQYVNGEDVFEVEKPKKWVVRSKNVDLDGYSYLTIYDWRGNRLREYSTKAHSMLINDDKYDATKFDTKEEANQFVNPLMEVFEVEDD